MKETMDYTPALIAAFASLVGAAFAASVALLVSILAKESKTSELRQEWIDAVRGDLAEYMAIMGTLEFALRLSDVDLSTKEGTTSFLAAHGKSVIDCATLEHRLNLRLNPREHAKLIELLDIFSKFSDRIGSPKSPKFESNILTEGQRILKVEWQRVKKGEPAFYWAKRLALGIVIGAIAAIVATAFRAS